MSPSKRRGPRWVAPLALRRRVERERVALGRRFYAQSPLALEVVREMVAANLGALVLGLRLLNARIAAGHVSGRALATVRAFKREIGATARQGGLDVSRLDLDSAEPDRVFLRSRRRLTVGRGRR